MNESRPYRFLNRDGSFNVERPGLRDTAISDLYHFSLRASWPRLTAAVVMFYLVINSAFGTLYYLCGPGALAGLEVDTRLHRLLSCFFFSVQTLATIGYGHVSPVSIAANCIVSVEALVGILSFAMATGLVFARFSRPSARVVFSEVALVTPHDGVPSLVFRMANARLNQIIEAQVSVILVRQEETAEGERYRNLYDLELERSRSPVFALSWTIVHPITPESPLYEQDRESLIRDQSEIVVNLTGVDETLSQPIHARFSYIADDLRWNMRFRDMISRTPSGRLRLDLSRIHEVEAQPS